MANNNSSNARKRPIFVDKDSHPLRFYLDESINKAPRKLLQKNIENHGGTVVVRAAHAEYVLISNKADRSLKQASYVTSTNPAKQALNIQYMNIIQNSIERDALTVEVDVVKGMSGHLGRKSGYTPQEDRNLAIWIASQIPSISSGGRKGDNLYKKLGELGETDAKFEWVKTHPWQSWQNRYKKNSSKFDELVEEVIPKVNPKRIHRFETNRKAGTSRLLGGRQFGDDEEGSEYEDDQSSRRSTPAQLSSRDDAHWREISSVASERHQSTLPEQPSRVGDTDSARDNDEVAMELEPSDEPSTHSRSQDMPSSLSQQITAQASDLEMPPSKRQRTGRSGQPVPTQNPGPKRGAYRPANAQESEESDSSGEGDNDNEGFAEVTFLDDSRDHVMSENAPIPKSPEKAVPLMAHHTISQGSTLVGTAPKLSLDRDEGFKEEGENVEENEILEEDFTPFSSSPNQGSIAGDFVDIQAPSPSPVPQAIISPPRPMPRPIASNAETRQRTPPPPRMTRARSRSQSVEPVFQSLPSRKAKGKGKAGPPPLSPQLESLQEEQGRVLYLDSHEVGQPKETLEDEEDVVQLVTNQQDYTPDISRTEEEFEAEYDEPGVGGISLVDERLSTSRAPLLESDDEEMSVQLGMRPPPPSSPKQPLRRTAKPNIAAALAELRDAPKRKRAPLNLPLDQLLAGIGSRPQGSLNSTRDRSFKQRTRDSMTGTKQGGSGTPFHRVVPRATSTTSSQETFPLQGTRASEYKRRRTQEDLFSPYKPPQGTRASALKSSPPN